MNVSTSRSPRRRSKRAHIRRRRPHALELLWSVQQARNLSEHSSYSARASSKFPGGSHKVEHQEAVRRAAARGGLCRQLRSRR